MRLRPFLINLGLVAIIIIVVFLILEFLLRVTGIQKVVSYNPPIYRTDIREDIAYSMIPSLDRVQAYGAQIRTNSMGFRSPENTSDSSPIVILGDSVVFGFGVDDDETIGSYLQQMMPDQFILSAGVCGYNLRQERAVYESDLAPLHPSALILFFMPNDFEEDYVLRKDGFLHQRTETDERSYEERVAEQVAVGIPIPFKGFLQRRSALFTFVERTTKNLPFRSHVQKSEIDDDPVTSEQLEAYGVEFRRFSHLVRDIPKVLVIWPEQNLRLRTRAFLREIGAEYGWQIVDLYEIYGNSYPSLGWDGHPNAKTNKKTANVLAEVFTKFYLEYSQ